MCFGRTWRNSRWFNTYTKNENYYGGDIPWITPKDLSILKERFISRGERNITIDGLNSCSTRIMPPHSVLFTSRAPIGYVAIALNELCTNQGFKSIIPNNETYYMFLYYLLLYNRDKIDNMGSGTTFKEISGSVMKNIDVYIPTDIEEQKKIASILSALDDKIELNKKINKTLEEMAKAIFDERFPNISDGTSIIGNIITPKRGKGLLSKNAVFGEVPVVAGGLEPVTYHNVANTEPPVLVISASGANAGYVSLWNIPVWSSDSSFIDIKMTKDVYFWYVMLKKRQKEIFDKQTGSAQPHIYPQHIADMPMKCVKQSNITNFTEIVTPIFEFIGYKKRENQRLAQLRDTLLPKLMSGEIRVK